MDTIPTDSDALRDEASVYKHNKHNTAARNAHSAAKVVASISISLSPHRDRDLSSKREVHASAPHGVTFQNIRLGDAGGVRD